MPSEFAYKRTWGPKPKYPLVERYVPPKKDFVSIAGPCSVENVDMINKIAAHVSLRGATHLRGGCFRAGTYPSGDFGWIKESLLSAYYWAAQNNKLENIIEILDYRDIPLMKQFCTCFQVGARQMQNYTLLKELGKSGKPIFLKRNMGATLDEWLGSAEWLLHHGCEELYLIERGSSTHLDHVRWDLSLSLIPSIKEISHIPIIVDPSHGTGRRDIVMRMAFAGVAAGAKGILLETHMDPDKSLSDPDQTISLDDYSHIINKINKLREFLK